MGVRVLFVCLGNICRSPMAEATFKQMVAEAKLSDEIEVDSAGTGSWHVGERAHPGTQRILAEHGINYNGRARQVSAKDLADKSTYVIAMDQSNMSSLISRYGEHPRLYRLLDFAPEIEVGDVPDPYYGGNFEQVYQMVEAGSRGLLETIIEQEELGATENDDR